VILFQEFPRDAVKYADRHLQAMHQPQVRLLQYLTKQETISSACFVMGALQILTLLAKSLENKSSKARDTGSISRNAHKECEQASNINSSSSNNMLEMRFHLSDIAASSEVEGSHALRDGSLNPRTDGLPILKFLGGLSFPGRLNGFMLNLGMEGDLTRVALCGRTLRTARAGQAILLPKLHMDATSTMCIGGPFPFPAGVPLRASHPMRFPINGKVAHAKALPCSPLPGAIKSDGTKDLDSVPV
jgi:hypothetical protein